MPRIILSINAGSSSVKVSVYKSSEQDPHEIADAEVSGISAPPAKLKLSVNGQQKAKGEELSSSEVTDQESAFQHVLSRFLKDGDLPDLKSKEDIAYVCHRIVHGGEYGKVQVIDSETFHYLEDLSDLAPLHNATGLKIVKSVHALLPQAVNMAYFDSAFHTTMPNHVRTYAIDPSIAEKNKLRKYGFHGISYSFITRTVAAYLEKPQDQTNIIALHLGSGASACAIQHGRSLDTSMGLTPLAGLPGGTRSGDVDPSLVFHYTHEAGKPSPSSTKNLHITTAEEILNKKSGFQALTGTSDFGSITEKANQGDEKCKLAFDLFVDRVSGFVGSYYVKLGGRVDALVFAGGIGEKGAGFRKRLVESCSCLGFELDDKKNEQPQNETVTAIGQSGARHQTLICHTDEQFEMARGSIREAEARSQ